MITKWVGAASCVLTCALAVCAADQVWNDFGADNTWSTNALNWDVSASWVNGNSAIFAGGAGTLFGETVDTSNDVRLANITFQTNGYVIADADNNGTLTFVGAPSVVTVTPAGSTGTISEVIAGSSGFTKMGSGTLNLTATNTYSGTAIVSNGTLRLASGVPQGLGATSTGNDTVVANGATLDFNGCFKDNTTTEKFTIAGSGVDGKGVLINSGPGHMNKSLSGVTLADHATIGGPNRIDVASVTGNGKTLTKSGAHQLCMGSLANAEIVINEGNYTLLANANALGGTTWGDTTLNGGTIYGYNDMTVPERIYVNGGTLTEGGGGSNTFVLAGQITLNSNLTVNSGAGFVVDLPGYLDGAGGLTQAGIGRCYITCATNSYTGPTTINSGCPLHVGKTNVYSGALGSGFVTNSGTLYGYSSRISQGNIVNYGTLFCNTGVLCGAGSVVNYGNLYFDRGGAFVCSNAFFGSGVTYLRYGGELTVSGSVSSNAQFRIGMGTLTLTNGADFRCYQEMQVADRLNMNYPVTDPSNLTAVINVPEGCTMTAQAITFGNGIYGSLTGILNQVGGVVRTTGTTAEGNGIRLGHYAVTYSVYNMMGGSLFVEKDYDLSCATDGKGWFNMTGGQVFTTRLMLNERDNAGGFGRLTVSGGVMNIGSLSGLVQAISNGIAADLTAPYLVEYGGAGGVIRAVTNIYSALSATLYGTNANAITFDTTNFAITLSGKLTGTGGLNKAGAGILMLTGTNTYSGGTAVKEGALTVAARSNLPNGELNFGIATNGTCGVLHATGDLTLTGLSMGVVNPAQLDKNRSYTVITYDGTISGTPSADNLPKPWYVYYDLANKAVQLRASIGTLIRMR